MPKCKHNWKQLNDMKFFNDDSGFYCIPKYHWCKKCGILKETRKESRYGEYVSKEIKHAKVC